MVFWVKQQLLVKNIWYEFDFLYIIRDAKPRRHKMVLDIICIFRFTYVLLMISSADVVLVAV